MAEVIKINVDENTGEFDVDLTGFHGKNCDDIIKAFGTVGEITTHIHKPEFREVDKKLVTARR